MDGAAYSILQPGSTVATALSQGESKPKHAFLLELSGRMWRTTHIPLETVRPFVFDNVELQKQASVDAQQPESIDAFLASRVERLITTATVDDTLPLIRLRVDYTGAFGWGCFVFSQPLHNAVTLYLCTTAGAGFSTINTQRFGHQFVGRVANPHDLLMWFKPKREKGPKKHASDAPIMPPAPDSIALDEYVREHLLAALDILPAQDMTAALQQV